jgi:hypothetical protein
MVETRKVDRADSSSSTWMPPSCGTRRSEMSSDGHDLDAADDGGVHLVTAG